MVKEIDEKEIEAYLKEFKEKYGKADFCHIHCAKKLPKIIADVKIKKDKSLPMNHMWTGRMDWSK